MKRPEQTIHRAVVSHLNWRAMPGVFFFHPANGGYRSKTEGAIFKGLGVKSGVPDLVIFYRAQIFGLELKAIIRDLTGGCAPWHSLLRQGGAALIGIFVFIVLHCGPASGLEIELSAKSGLPACSVPISIEHIANANDSFVVHYAAGYDLIGEDRVERQFDAMHSTLEANWRRYLFMLKLDFAWEHSLGETENMASNTSYRGIGISRIDISETYRDRLATRNAPAEGQAIYDNPWPVCRDEFFIAEFGGFLGGRDGALQLDALPTKYEELEKGDNGKSASSPKKQLSEAREPPIVLCLFILAVGVGGGLLFTLFGWQNFYNDRRLLGATLIGLGCLIGLSGLGWWWSWLL